MRNLNRDIANEVSPHRYHKKKPLDCGNTQCGLCRNTWGSSGEKYRPDYIDEAVFDEETRYMLYLEEADDYIYDGLSYMTDKQYEDARKAMEDSARASKNLIQHYFGAEEFSALSHVSGVL